MEIDAEEIIPHRFPMRMIDALVECEGGSARARSVLPEGHVGVARGRVLESALVECVAQAAAAMKGYQARRAEGQAAIGLLAGVSGFVVRERPAAGKVLEIVVREETVLGPLRLVSGQVFCDGEVVASGTLKLHG